MCSLVDKSSAMTRKKEATIWKKNLKALLNGDPKWCNCNPPTTGDCIRDYLCFLLRVCGQEDRWITMKQYCTNNSSRLVASYCRCSWLSCCHSYGHRCSAAPTTQIQPPTRFWHPINVTCQTSCHMCSSRQAPLIIFLYLLCLLTPFSATL